MNEINWPKKGDKLMVAADFESLKTEIIKLRQTIARRESHQDIEIDELRRRNGCLELIIRESARHLDNARHAAQGPDPIGRRMLERMGVA